MRSADFLDQTVSAEQSELASDGSRLSAFILGLGWTGPKQGPQVAIAEALEGKLGATDRRE